MIKVINFTVYSLLDLGASLSFVNTYVSMKFDAIPEQLIAPFIVSMNVDEPILTEQFYRDCVISINYKDTMDYLLELDMGYFDIN